MRTLAWTFALLAFAGTGRAQDNAAQFDFETMDLREAGVLDFNFETGQIDRITNGADVVLYGKEKGDLRIRAQSIIFRWTEGSEQPDTIDIEGNVVIDHPRASIKAEKGVWNVADGVITFTGSPVLRAPQFKEMTAQKMELNITTGQARFIGGTIQGMQMKTGPGGGTATPGLLTRADIVNWSGLLSALKEAHASEAPSPGKEVLKWVAPQVRNLLPGIVPDQELSPENQEAMVGELNKALRAPLLYSEEAWANVTIGEEAKGMIAKGIDTLTPAETTLLNRRLVEAAYPDFITAAPSAG